MKINFYSFLYILCIVSSFFPNYEVTFLIWLITFLLTLKKKYSVTIFIFIALFLGILTIATISSLFYSYQTFSMVKDFTYLLKPILGLLVGYQIFEKFKTKAFDIFIKTGVILSSIHIFLILLAFIKFHSIDMNLIRLEAGFFSDYEVYVFVLLLYSNKFNIEIAKRKRIFFMLLIG
uniref:hypothetical protein n=1 Tax=Flavobacterium sp. TaxID=239 RepID=UPI004049407E